MILYACSTNAGKLAEFALAGRQAGIPGLNIEPLPGLERIPAPDETGSRFEENASIKARFYSRFTSELVFADDSGLEVSVLGDAPGVHSARYAGASSTDAANNTLLLRNLQNENNRAARFVCVIALARAGRVLVIFRGSVEGLILASPEGTGGFGYDPLFFYPPLAQSFAQIGAQQKFSVSHRGEALRKLFASLSSDMI